MKLANLKKKVNDWTLIVDCCKLFNKELTLLFSVYRVVTILGVLCCAHFSAGDGLPRPAPAGPPLRLSQTRASPMRALSNSAIKISHLCLVRGSGRISGQSFRHACCLRALWRGAVLLLVMCYVWLCGDMHSRVSTASMCDRSASAFAIACLFVCVLVSSSRRSRLT